MYLASSPEHALGETLAAFRGTKFRSAYLTRMGRPLALVEVELSDTIVGRIVDLTDPAILSRYNIRPDVLAHHDREVTQGAARRIHTGLEGDTIPGFAWWSMLTGAWHTTVLFADRIERRDLRFGTPTPVTAQTKPLLETLAIRGINPPS